MVALDLFAAQKGTEKGRPSSPGLTARSFSFVKGEFQKLTPCGCSDMLKFKSLSQKKTSSGLDGEQQGGCPSGSVWFFESI